MLRVVTAAEAAARDAAAIRAGTPARDLMQRAGVGAADLVLDQYPEACASGVMVFTGPGNNGGDGWVMARRLAEQGIPVRVVEVEESRTPDAIAEREDALPLVSLDPVGGEEGVVVDALLGTGARPGLDRDMAEAVAWIESLRRDGAVIVSLDLPTGTDASSGAEPGGVLADLTITFGSVKRGHLTSRGTCGEVVVLDIGLEEYGILEDGSPVLVDAAFVEEHVPAISAESHKGSRRRIAIVGGARGMAGAVMLAGEGAIRSGVGMVRLLVEEPSLGAVQVGLREATAVTWPAPPDEYAEISAWAHALLIGPGLGRSESASEMMAAILESWRGPTVLDADALNHFAGDVEALAAVLARRPAIITPHATELARLLGVETSEVNDHRFEIGRDLARTLGATVLLKGVPTVIFAPDGARYVSATGTPVLAAAGSGDILGGIATTLLAQSGDPVRSAACAAWIHGRAAELANAGRPVRGVTLGDVMAGLSHAWRLDAMPLEHPVLAVLPRAGDLPGLHA